MKTLLKGFGILVAIVVLVIVGVFIAARFHDGPFDGGLAIIAGGPFTSGTLYSGEEPDWSFLEDRETVQFQLLDPARSRTTWIVVVGDRIFIPSGYMNTPFGKLWKQWPKEAERDGRAILRVDGVLYERTLKRIGPDDPVLPAVLAELSRKYGNGQTIPVDMVASGDLWIFEVAPR